MKRTGWLISRYLISTIVPYFVFSWLLLSVILFVQQASRYSDIFFSVNIPAHLVWQLTFALIPSVVAFTCPIAVLVGTIIGLSKIQGDNELVIMRASGVGNLQIIAPIAVLGGLMSIFAFVINWEGVPLAAGLVRNVALQTAIKKLESPVDPGVFNTEVSGYTIYVLGGDLDTGRWKDIFLYSEDKDAGSVRVITSENGRIDTTEQLSELVLENASVATLPLVPGRGKYATENIGEVRIAIKTKRADLIDKLSSTELTADELGLQQLRDYAASKVGIERIEAQLVWERRIILSVTPLIFCLLGAMIVLRFNRGGRGFGLLAALIVLIGFYLLAFLGEQLARVGTIGVFSSGLIPIAGSAIVIVWFSQSRNLRFWNKVSVLLRPLLVTIKRAPGKLAIGDFFVDLTTGLRDFEIVRNLIKNIALALGFLISIFLIFTAFELWKFAGTFQGGLILLLKYLVYLLPFVYLQIAPSAAMIGILATFIIKSRQNEIVTWTSSGQSVYRLLAPCFVLMILLGGVNWAVQEKVLPRSNQLQDLTRDLIRGRGVASPHAGRSWVAVGTWILSFESESAGKSGDDANTASDNEKRDCPSPCVRDPLIFQFGDNPRHLQSVYRGERAFWSGGRLQVPGTVEENRIESKRVATSLLDGWGTDIGANPLTDVRTKPNHLDSRELKRMIDRSESETDQRSLSVALERKYATLFLPFVLVLFTAPFSLSLSRKGKAATVGYAVGLWLAFTGLSTVFEQLGLNGLLTPAAAIWTPLVVFALFGVYLMATVKT